MSVKLSLTIQGKKLGFTLQRDATTPTIEKITPDGEFHKLLKKDVLDIDKPIYIESVQQENIEYYSYEKAIEKIKSLNERPLQLTVRGNLKVPEIRNSFIPTSNAFKLSSEEMKQRSEKTTQQELKKLNEFMKQKSQLSDSEEETSSPIESKYHYLQLNYSNLQVDYQERVREIQELRELLVKTQTKIKDEMKQWIHLNQTLENMTKFINETDTLVYSNYTTAELKRYQSISNENYWSMRNTIQKEMKELSYESLSNFLQDSLNLFDTQYRTIEFKMKKMTRIKFAIDTVQCICVLIGFIWILNFLIS